MSMARMMPPTAAPGAPAPPPLSSPAASNEALMIPGTSTPAMVPAILGRRARLAAPGGIERLAEDRLHVDRRPV